DQKYTFGHVTPFPGGLWYSDPDETSWFNGLRFVQVKGVKKDEHGYPKRAYAGDVVNHRIIQIDAAANQEPVGKTLCQDSRMIQPNDIAVTPSQKFVYASGQRWADNNTNKDGDLWVCNTSTG